MVQNAARPRTLLLTLVLVAAGPVACVPSALSAQLTGPEAQAVERAANEAFHRMELGLLATGTYTTNVLVDVDLPRGARVTVEAFSGDDYRLRFDTDAIDGVEWIVSPRGVSRVVQR